jgi:hypothetical protein
MFTTLLLSHPDQTAEVQRVRAELSRDHTAAAS